MRFRTTTQTLAAGMLAAVLSAACVAWPTQRAVTDLNQPGPNCGGAIQAFTSDPRYQDLIATLYQDVEVHNQSQWQVDASSAIRINVLLYAGYEAIGDIDAQGKLTLRKRLWRDDSICKQLTVKQNFVNIYDHYWQRPETYYYPLGATVRRQILNVSDFARPMKVRQAEVTLSADGLEYSLRLLPGDSSTDGWVRGVSVVVTNRGASFATIRRLALYIDDRTTVMTLPEPVTLAPGQSATRQVFEKALPDIREPNGQLFWTRGAKSPAIANAVLNHSLNLAIVPDATVGTITAGRASSTAKIATFVDGYAQAL